METIVRNNSLKVNGVSYFRTGAEHVQLGSYGRKRTEVAKRNRLEVKNDLSLKGIKGIRRTELSINFEKSSKSAFGGTISAIIKGVNVEIDGSGAIDKLKKGKLKLVKIIAPQNEFKKAINRQTRHRASLKTYKTQARVATSIFLIVEAKLASKIISASDITLSGNKGDMKLDLNFKNESARNVSIQFSEGSTFAYMISRLKWDKKIYKKRERVVELKEDQVG